MNSENKLPRHNLFPQTRHSAFWLIKSEALSDRKRGLDLVARAYLLPVEKYLQIKWHFARELSRDTAQGFFLAALEKRYFEEFDPAKARFRTFLRLCVDRYVMKQLDAESSIKRGGAAEIIRIDDLTNDSLHHASGASEMDAFFDQEWTRNVLAMAVEALRERCEQTDKRLEFTLFERYDIIDSGNNRPTYGDLAGDYGITAVTVTNHLAWARREFRETVLDIIRGLTSSEEEFRDEVRALLGVEPT